MWELFIFFSVSGAPGASDASRNRVSAETGAELSVFVTMDLGGCVVMGAAGINADWLIVYGV